MQMLVRTSDTRLEAAVSVTSPASRSRTLDVLRGIAIASVMAIHVSQSFPSGLPIVDVVFFSGWAGVNVFYFVSALTMCLMWTQREGEEHPTRRFYIRRFLRIAPLFWCAIPLYLALNGMGPSYDAPDGIALHQVILTALLLHGFWPDAINSVVPGDWSIAAEMTFYAVFPIVIASFGARRHLYLVLAIAIHVFNVCFFKPWAYGAFVAYYGPGHEAFVWNALHLSFLNQLPVFLTGCALFFALREGFAKWDVAIVAGWIALAFVGNRATPSHEFDYLVINLAIGALVYGCIRLAICFRPLEVLGRNSYSIYLSHFAVIQGLRLAWPLADTFASLLTAYALTALLSYLVSVATWHLVERRTQALAKRLTASPEGAGRMPNLSPVTT